MVAVEPRSPSLEKDRALTCSTAAESKLSPRGSSTPRSTAASSNSERSLDLFGNMNEACGSTPVLRLRELEQLLGVHTAIYMKMESGNPLGSVKDRVANGMLKRAIADGRLTPGSGQMLVESSSGNLAVALAQQCVLHGFRFTCVVDESALTKVAAAEVFGATIDAIKVEPGWTTSQIKAARRVRVQELLKSTPGSVHLDQYNSSDNEATHEDSTGPEIYKQVGDELELFVAAVSTGGQLCGAGGYLKRMLPALRLAGVEPVGSGIFDEQPPQVDYLNAGSGLDMTCARVKRALHLIDAQYQVPDDAALAAVLLLARTEGVLVGPSTGQGLCGLLQELKAHPETRSALFMNCDGGRIYTKYIADFQREHFPAADAAEIYAALAAKLPTFTQPADYCTTLECEGCGYRFTGQPAGMAALPFRCPCATPADHVLAPLPQPLPAPEGQTTNPFLKFRSGLVAYRLARSGGLTDAWFCNLVKGFEARVTELTGKRFGPGPVEDAQRALQQALAHSGSVWLQNETGMPGGSHKIRHMVGPLLYLEVVRELNQDDGPKPGLAIASCGNAALAAAVACYAAGYALTAFIPPDCEACVQRELRDLGAEVVPCPRRASDPPGDPCVFRFKEALETGGVLPICCQSDMCGLNVESGQTLVWELLANHSGPLDHIVLQVGGGALGSSACRALRRAVEAGRLPKMPQIHTVQTKSCAPLQRAYELLQTRVLQGATPEQALAEARDAKLSFMWAWESEPHSIAPGILDDETSDWFALVSAMLATGGRAVTVEEGTLAEAHRTAHGIGVNCCETGSSGLAGVLQLKLDGTIQDTESVAVIFSGVQR
jgi:threonine synthase